jgi:hypothetical protein
MGTIKEREESRRRAMRETLLRPAPDDRLKHLRRVERRAVSLGRTLDKELTKCTELALDFVEARARRALRLYSYMLDEFVMAMGSAYFTDKTSETTLSVEDVDPLLAAFIGRWDGVLYLTGEPMRFRATSERCTDW